MTELISREAQKVYADMMSSRVEYGVFTDRDTAANTKANTEFIRQFAHMEGVNIRRFTDNGVKLEDISIPGARAGKYIYYIHGGGFVAGEPAWGYYYAVEAAKLARRRIFSVDYRLSPEYPFPQGPEDCIYGYQYLLGMGIRAEDVVFLGESSGGNLILAVCAACKERNIPMPAALCPVSPVVDLSFSFPSYTQRGMNGNAYCRRIRRMTCG